MTIAIIPPNNQQLYASDLLESRTDASNLFPDPFFELTDLSSGYRNPLESPISFEGGWEYDGNDTGGAYPIGNVIVRPLENVTAPYMYLDLPKMGIVPGDTITIGIEARTDSGSDKTSGNFLIGRFLPSTGSTGIGSDFDMIVPTVSVPFTTTRSMWQETVTVPTEATKIRLHGSSHSVVKWRIESLQVTRGTVANPPTKHWIPTDLGRRLTALENGNLASLANSMLLRRTAYDSLTQDVLLGGSSTAAAFGGYGQGLLASACPVGGFNAIRDTWAWSSNSPPVAIYVGVTTAATGSNSLNEGELIAWGSIGVDPEALNGDNQPIQLFDLSGQPKTVMPADLSDLMGIFFFGVTATGEYATNIAVSRQNSDTSLADPADVGYRILANAFVGLGAGWSSIATSYIWGPKLCTLTNPKTSFSKASLSLSKSVGLNITDIPELISVPPVIYSIVGKAAELQYATTQLADHRTFNMYGTGSTTIPTGSGNNRDNWRHIPTSAGDYTVTLTAEVAGKAYSSASTVFRSVAASSGAGTARFLMLGDSLTMNGNTQARLNTLAAADGVTSVVNMGTVGADPVKNEGYSGQSTAIFFTPGNPFYNAGDFDFANYMTNPAVGADPTHVLIATGFWDGGARASDSAAAAGAISWVTALETMIASIHAYNASINVGVWTQPVSSYQGQQADPTTINSDAQRRRNQILFGQAAASNFSGREGDNIYHVPCGNCMNPQTAYGLNAMEAIDAGVLAQVDTEYADYATMAAVLTKADGTIVKGGSKYYVKVGPSAAGYWREATERDGFAYTESDSIHFGTKGYASIGDQVFAWFKNTL